MKEAALAISAACLISSGLHGLSQCDVRTDAVVEEDGFLCNYTHEITDGMQAVFPDIDAVNEHFALRGINEAQDEVGQGALTRTATAHQCHRLSLFQWSG